MLPDYRAAALWGDTALIAYGTDYLPPNPPSWEAAGDLGDDGFAGAFEYILYPQPFDHTAPFMPFVELPCASNASLINYRKDDPADYSNRTKQSDFIASEATRREIQERTWYLRAKYTMAARVLRKVLRADIWPENRIAYRIASETISPLHDAKKMVTTFGKLAYQMLKGKADWRICLRGWQRHANVTSGFMDFVGALLWAGSRKDVPQDCLKDAEWLVTRRQAHNLGAERRGAIFVGGDVQTYTGFYRKLGVPVFVRVTVDTLDHGGIPLRPTSAPRCAMEVSTQLSKSHIIMCPHLSVLISLSANIGDRHLPLECYPPQEVLYIFFERVWRGTLPRDDSYKPSRSIVAQKKHADNAQQGTCMSSVHTILIYDTNTLYRAETAEGCKGAEATGSPRYF